MHRHGKLQVAGWLKSNNWRKALKNLMRSVGQTSRGGGKNKEERLQKVISAYLKKSHVLEKKVAGLLSTYTANTLKEILRLAELTYYYVMLTKHTDLLERRLIKKETIPHNEKVFSIFQSYTEWINKGKLHPNVEIGKKLFVTSDQYHLMVDWQVGENQTDNQLTLPIAERIAAKHPVQSLTLSTPPRLLIAHLPG